MFFDLFVVGCFVFFCGWFSSFYFRKQLLVSLISLEVLVIRLFIGVIYCFSFLGKSLSVTFYVLVLGACEAALGLCLLVCLVRLGGRDALSVIRAVKC